MAKKREKDAGGPREAVRGAVESTFQRAAGGASRAQELLDDVATTLKALRDANLVETLESVRDEVQSLARRVAALELRTREQSPPATTARKAAPARKAATTRKTTAAKKPAAAKKTTTTAKKKPAPAKKQAAARKPAATRKSG